MSGHNDYAEFEIDDGDSKTSWTRQLSPTDNDTLTDEEKWKLYHEGNAVRLQYVKQKFKSPSPGFEISHCVLGIWVRPPGNS
ncbi:hypothetical protein Mal64_02570 [Pseudobythopirellula maris]|uniref:Uncharacterized protein n=2 Tax=Pseudobythopirellula maris TaxID=2527991 RepID=A0A5C5ZS11_9BACT|nr:hypothetical protein Mal64_02570 [Pseudobythopirellula maris]